MPLLQVFSKLGVKKAYLEYDVADEKFKIGTSETGRDLDAITIDGVTGSMDLLKPIGALELTEMNTVSFESSTVYFEEAAVFN